MVNAAVRYIRAYLLLVLCLPLIAQAQPRVLASIKPLALIAQEVAGSEANVETLLPITASPHDYPLKVSDHRRLREADLVIWIGPELESFLSRALANVPPQQIVTAYGLPGIHWPAADAHQGDKHHQHANHAHIGKDPHLWLDPRNARVIARVLAEKLAGLHPEGAAVYHQNANDFIARVMRIDERLHTQLRPVKAQGFAVYHEGYSHFVGRYGLHQVGYVTYAPERRPGAKHLKELQGVLKKEGKCLFIEPYYEVKSIQTMAQSLGLRIGILDPIGSEHVSSYSQLMEALGNSFLTCLADTARH
jgi:zinc transport system substrate-binding protein